MFVDVLTATDTRLGAGPIMITQWRHTARLDRAGIVEMTAPATDERTSLLELRSYVRCWDRQLDTFADFGHGIIDTIDINTEAFELTASGDDLLRELSLRTVFDTALKDAGETALSLADALDLIIAACNANSVLVENWTIDTATYGAGDTHEVYHTFSGESILAALIKVAELTGTHFRLGTGREIVWLFTEQPDSGIRAVIGVEPIAAESNTDICLITDLSFIVDSSDLISRIYPYGSGSGGDRLTLSGTTRAAPAGYVLDTANNYLERTAAATDYGFGAFSRSFNDIAPAVDPGDPDYAAALESAQNTLFDAALEWLRNNSYPQESYSIEVTKLDQQVRPGETMRVIYRGWVDGYKWVDIDRDLIIREATVEIDDAGVRTPGLIVSSIPRWPLNEQELLRQLYRDVQQGQAHRQ